MLAIQNISNAGYTEETTVDLETLMRIHTDISQVLPTLNN